MIALVTGAAGFIGSQLCEQLLASGEDVRAIDAFTEYYSRSLKERNLAGLRDETRFELVEGDLVELPLQQLLEDVDVVYHVAGQPGVTASWGRAFDPYVRHNIVATQRLLEACRELALRKFVFASSSSVYGDANVYPLAEDVTPRPVSPYGVTKLAAEQLCSAYQAAYGLPVASLRLFTVYGPRQRPDMAFARLLDCALNGGTFELRGDGKQVRDCTFVADVVSAMLDAAAADWVGIANVGGGSPTTMTEVIDLVTELCGPFAIQRTAEAPGDMRRTEADIDVAARAFGYVPRTSLREGLEAMLRYEQRHRVSA